MKQQKLESWSLGKNNRKLIPQGGEILKSIGSEMLYVRFERQEDGTWTADNPVTIFVESIRDYDPMTGTYELVYTREKKTHTTRITPEGFSFNNPEDDGWMERFVTYSLHFKMMEEELYYNRLRSKFNTSEGVLPIESISVLAGGKQKESLGYHNYISAVIDTDVEGGIGMGILAFRISEFTKVDKKARSWSFGLRDWDGFYMYVQKYQETEDKGWVAEKFTVDGTVLGDLKIMDIEDPKPSNP